MSDNWQSQARLKWFLLSCEEWGLLSWKLADCWLLGKQCSCTRLLSLLCILLQMKKTLEWQNTDEFLTLGVCAVSAVEFSACRCLRGNIKSSLTLGHYKWRVSISWNTPLHMAQLKRNYFVHSRNRNAWVVGEKWSDIWTEYFEFSWSQIKKNNFVAFNLC